MAGDMDIARLGFEADATPLKKTNDELKKLGPNADRAETATEKLNREFIKGKGAANAFALGLSNIGSRIGGSLKNDILGFGRNITAAFGLAALVTKLGQVADQLDTISKAARAVNSTVKDMQALAVAGELAGVGVDALAAATRRNNRVLGDAIAKGKGTEGVFKRLGISARELASMPIDERFATIADRMKELGFSSADTAAALAELGDRGGSLIGLLGEGGEQIRQAAKDVERFNLAISDEAGLKIEEMNDNFTRLGYSIQGAFNQFIAFIAPTLATIFIAMADGIAFVVDNIGMVAPIAQIAGAGLIAAFGPATLMAVVSLSKAILTGLVGSIRAVTAAIAANPIGALVTALAMAVTAVWVFRDAISKAIGVDVEAIFKGAANFIIQSMMTAFEQAKLVWSAFPNVLGAATIGAANLVVKGLNFLIGKSIEGINNLIGVIHGIPGMDKLVSKLDPKFGQLTEMADPYSAKIVESWTLYQDTVREIARTDYVGQIAESMTKLSEANSVTTETLGNVGSAMGKADAGASSLKDRLERTAEAAGKAYEKLKAVRDEIAGSVAGAFKSFFTDIMHGKSAIDSLTDALGNLADKLMGMVMDAALNGIISSLFGGGVGGGSIAGIMKPMFGAVQRSAKGNVFGSDGIVNRPTLFPFAKGTGLMGEAGPEAIMPLKRASNGALGVIAAANDNRGSGVVFLQPIINNNASDQVEATAGMDNEGNLVVTIDKINASLINDSGSRTNKAMQGSFGMRNAVKGR